MTIRGDGEQRRDFTHVDDVVDANVRCMEYTSAEFKGDIYNIGNGDNRSVNQIAELIGGDRININSKRTKRPFLYVWGFDRVEKIFWKDELCKLSRLGI